MVFTLIRANKTKTIKKKEMNRILMATFSFYKFYEITVTGKTTKLYFK